MTTAESQIIYWLTRIRDGIGTAADNWQAIINILRSKGDAI